LALQLDPNLVEARWAMGYSNEVVGNYAGAIEHYEKAVELQPNLWTLYIKLGLMYRQGLQRPDQAIIYFSKANALDPKNVTPFLYLSRTYYQIDKPGTAIQYLEQALALEPDNADIYGRLGLLLFKRKNYEGAEPLLRIAIFGGEAIDVDGTPVLDDQQNPIPVVGMPLAANSLEYYYTLGNLRAFNASPQNLESCGSDFDDAPTLLQQAVNFAPEDPTVLGSYAESMNICDRVSRGLPGATSTPDAPTPTPSP
jgi:tetratricopeptide (TPR) repeat protein